MKEKIKIKNRLHFQVQTLNQRKRQTEIKGAKDYNKSKNSIFGMQFEIN